ncbi:major facilitator superfamily domain-containing protein [Fusarium flagelliforme]|uniref:major facilitator superfamily domain-containing protein n=1 Tax=Fusarium flagelliforme TaxID=2675880 RepID=UPI001E8D477F|nr:major facilitator superfamily domain-containing protein [Fusarium flagelliforme]KAH7178969.1 major facilitator superfamily domain-containing protein [Fusarium flagelliforme]
MSSNNRVAKPCAGLIAVEDDKKDAFNTDKAKAIEQAEKGSVEDPDVTATTTSARESAFAELGIPDWKFLEKKLVRRLDMTLLPTLWLLYVFNYLDRASLGQARLSTLDEDLRLEGSQFGSAVSILSAGYVLGQVPSNMIIGKIRPSLYLPGMAILWSGVSAAIAGVKSYEGLLAVRFFLGLVEAPLFPGAIYVMSSWYTRREIAVRIAIMSTGVSLANGLSGLIAAAVFSTLEGARGVAGWQWLFIVLALFGSAFALVAIFLLPDYPQSKSGSAMWTMTEDMRKVAQVRIIADRVSELEIQSTIWTGVKLTIIDYKFWLLTGINISISAAYGFSNFYPAIVRGLGYDRVTALLLTFPPYCVAAPTSIAVAWNSDRVGERGWHFSTPIAVGLAGYVICMVTTATVPRYSASYLFIGGLFGANPLIQTWLSTTLARTPEKKAVSVALCNVLSQIGNVIAPFFFIDSDEPQYRLAFILMFLMGGLCISFALALKYCLWRENKRLFQEAQENGTPYMPYLQ